MKALFIIAPINFRDEEYFVTKHILEEDGIDVTTSSNSETSTSEFGKQVKIDVLLENVDSDYDVIIFVGGSGAISYFDDSTALELAKKFFDEGKVVSAICIGPAILAKAGVLDSKRATVWAKPNKIEGIEILEENGASYVNQNVVIDGKIITANGPEAAEEFGKKILEVLK